MRIARYLSAAVLATGLSAAPASADDRITLTGCVAPAPPATVVTSPSFLVWSESGVMMTDVVARLDREAPIGTAGTGVPILLWIDDEDDVARYAGQYVEVRGEVSDELETGEVEVDENDNFIEIEFEWDGDDVRARMPKGLFLGRDVDDTDFDVVVRRIDVEDVKVVPGGSCR